jgi:hypothetical protein
MFANAATSHLNVVMARGSVENGLLLNETPWGIVPNLFFSSAGKWITAMRLYAITQYVNIAYVKSLYCWLDDDTSSDAACTHWVELRAISV